MALLGGRTGALRVGVVGFGHLGNATSGPRRQLHSRGVLLTALPGLWCTRALKDYGHKRWHRFQQATFTVAQAVAAPERPRTLPRQSSSKAAELERPRIGYELIQGRLVRWSERDNSGKPPPTCVLVHGILGSRKNMVSFAHRIVEGFPTWQVVVCDLRCHGESAMIGSLPGEPHNVQTSAGDVLALLRQLKLFPEVLVGHSFGGKVVMSMAQQFSSVGSRMPCPVQVWVLDALPGEVRAGDAQRQDHPADLIARLQQLKMPVANRTQLQAYLIEHGFSDHIAKWASTNLRPIDGDTRQLTWSFDLDGIAEMYRSYESASLWGFLQKHADGIHISFVRAEHSTFRWAGQDQDMIASLGHRIYFLHDAGHWVHTDNPEGLFAIMAPSFGVPELQTRGLPGVPASAVP